MSRFVTYETERHELGDGDWVEYRIRLPWRDRRAVHDRLIGAGQPPGSADDDGIYRGAGNLELLLRSIVAWGGPGFCSSGEHPHEGDCKPRPISAQTLDEMDVTAERLLLVIGARQIRGTPDFTRPPSPITPTGGVAQSGSSTSSSSNGSASK